ncbi:NlpC/P60 family protein [Streptomyces sp. NPDC060194]|uniref:C40 family peptidase n=1 Tax=Streptomyces sp. NPDC060194 TaxID=3347069 RepID=UPI00366401E0
MVEHRKPKPLLLAVDRLGGTTARTATALTLAGAAGATALGGTGHADPAPTPAQIKSRVDTLRQEAEVATQDYNGTREKADRLREQLDGLRDEATRRTAKLNTARNALGSLATAQYRSGGVDPAVRLALSSDPDNYLERSALAELVRGRQAAAVRDVQRQVTDIQRIRATADDRADDLRQRQTELTRHKKRITAKLAAAQDLLDRLSPADRAALADGPATGAADGSPRASRDSSGPRAGVPAPSARAAQAVSFAYAALGSPYRWGASGPDAFDCSGLTQAAWRAAGVGLPRTTYTQINAGRRVSQADLAPGDLVFFYSGLSHVGLYVGNGQMIHAPNSTAPVRLAPIDQMPFAGAARPV